MDNKVAKTILAVTVVLLVGVDAASAKPKRTAARLQPYQFELTFKSHVNNREKIDLGAPGGSLGDMVLGNGDVLDLNNNVIGAVEYQGVVTHLTPTTEQRWLQSEYSFGDGTDTILMEGASEFETPSGLPAPNTPYLFAVTGGTGKYFGASGECTATRPDGVNFITQCWFTAFKPPRK